MEIIKPSVEIWHQGEDWQAHVAKCARVCYASKKITDNEQFCNGLIKASHYSMFRHVSHYFIGEPGSCLHEIALDFFGNPGVDVYFKMNKVYVVANGNWVLDNPDQYYMMKESEVTIDDFKKDDIAKYMIRYTFKVVTQISTSRELNRVSPNNIAERSTRYVYENGTLCCPHWISEDEMEVFNNEIIIPEKYLNNDNLRNYMWQCDNSFQIYKKLVDNGLPREDARGVLPLDTATICIYTYSVDEWRHIIDLRYYGTTGKPHPNAKVIAGMIRTQLINEGYAFRE